MVHNSSIEVRPAAEHRVRQGDPGRSVPGAATARDRLPVREIAKQTALPEPYFAKIVRQLTSARLVRAFRGPDGGIALVQSPQAVVDGRGDTIKDLYPNAAVDHYPFQAASLDKGSPAQREMEVRYSPARVLGNHMSGPRDRPVEELIAEGPGTLTSASPAGSNGRGRRTQDGWSVLISRPLPDGLAPGRRSQVAFAVWEGSQQEGGSRKLRSGWIPIVVEAKK